MMRSRLLSLGAIFMLAGCVAHPGDNVPPDMVAAISTLPAAKPDAQAAAALQAPPPAQPGPRAEPPMEPASPGAERLTVRAPLNFAGIWRLYAPHRIAIRIGIPTDVTYSDVGPSICRVLQAGAALHGACVSDKVEQLTGTATAADVRLDLHSAGPAVRIVAAVRDGQALRGNLRVRLLAVVPLPELPVTGVKLDARRYPVPQPGTDARIRAAIAELAHTQPDIAAMGAVTSLTHIELVPVFGPKSGEKHLVDVFTANFDNGTRLCSFSGKLICG